MNVRRIVDTKPDFNLLMEMTDFFLNYVITKGMVPGKVESWTCICDMQNVGATQMPKNQIQGIVKSMSKNYRGRLFKFYATYVTFFVRTVWIPNYQAFSVVSETLRSNLRLLVS